jgi:hypothetical protein
VPGDDPGAPGSDPSIMGGAFRDAAWILRREWARVIGLSILVVTPLEAGIAWLQQHAPGKPYSPLAIAFSILTPWLLQGVVAALYIGGLAWSIDRRLHGERTSLADLVLHAFRRWPTMVRVELVTSGALLGGLVLLVAPGLVAISRWLIAPQVAAMEGGGVRDALARSAYLTKGRRWLALGVFALELIAYYGGYYAITLPLQAIIGPAFLEPVPIALNRYLFSPLYGALMMGLSVVFYTAFFHRLVATRGSRGEIAAQVFD